MNITGVMENPQNTQYNTEHDNTLETKVVTQQQNTTGTNKIMMTKKKCHDNMSIENESPEETS